MAIIKCKECGNLISDKASQCPRCGAPVLNTANTHPTPPYPTRQVSHKSNKGLLIGLCIALTVALAGLAFVLIKNHKDNKEAAQQLAIIEKGKRNEKKAQAMADSLKKEAERQEQEKARLEAERHALEAQRRAEAEAERLKSATGVYTGKIYGVRARMSLKQNGSYVSGTYTGNTRKYTVNGSIDDSNYFDLTIYNNSMAEARITGYINGHKMSGTWEEYLTGNIYEFKLMR